MGIWVVDPLTDRNGRILFPYLSMNKRFNSNQAQEESNTILKRRKTESQRTSSLGRCIDVTVLFHIKILSTR
jgi:hypothetical protein